MPRLTPLYVIAVQEPSAALRDGIQDLVQTRCPHWWHELPDVWIVEGGDAAEWRDLVDSLKIAAASDATVLVIRLGDDGNRAWAASGPDISSRVKWLKQYFTGSLEPDGN